MSMEYIALSIETNAFEFYEQLHMINGSECEVDFDFNVRLRPNMFAVEIDMQYYRSIERLSPLASVRATLKFWTQFEQGNVSSGEKLLFAVKTLHRHTCFLLYQRLKSTNITGFYLPTPTDQELFSSVKSKSMVNLEFDETGRYFIGL